MPGCPSCGRPVALARPSCLYCGEPLSQEQVARAAAAARTVDSGLEGATPDAAGVPGAPGGPPRVLLVLDLAGVPAEALAAAAGLSAYDAQLLARRGGLHLLRALDAGAAASVAVRIGGAGVRVFTVPEAEARVRPVRVVAGERRGTVLVLRGEEGVVEIGGEELLLIVGGGIAREPLPRFARRRVDAARFDEGWLVHQHREREPRPLEIDALNFAPGFAVTGSSRLEIEAWLQDVAPAVPRDHGFRSLAAALAPAEPEPRGPLAAASSLRRGSSRPSSGRTGPQEAPALLDNVAQFRFYSGWRAAVERRRRGSPPPPSAC
jgi:hypothetical protein